MAEPMSSNEIEDVLSSIRRLVAQDLKPSDRVKLAAVADATQKLVLAPENRVEQSPRDGAAQAAKFATVRRPSRRAAFPPVDSVLDGVSRSPSAVVQSQGQDDWALGDGHAQIDQPDLSPAQSDAMQSALDQSLLPEDAPQQSVDVSRAHDDAHTKFHVDEERDTFIPIPPGYGEDDAPMADGEFTIDPNARMFDMDAASFATNVAAPQEEWRDPEPEDASDVNLGPTTSQDGHSLHGTIEPDTDWADAAEARVIAELAGEAVADEVVAQSQDRFREPSFKAAPQSASEVLFDEEQLRAMVQAIFREEMAGPMGERITRNIRKLVRAEVGRMLAAHELE